MDDTAEPRRNVKSDFRMTGSQELCLDLIRICMAQFIVLGHFLALSDNRSWLAKMPLSGLRVSVFFMLSGFLIFATTWRRQGAGYTFREFLIERSARLWVCLVPALAFSAFVASMIADLPGYPATQATGPLQFIGNLLMLEDYPLFQILRRLGFDSSLYVRPYATAEPYWTLPIEFWLYVVFGYLFFFVHQRHGKPSFWTNALAVVAFGAVVYHASTGWGQCLSLIWLVGAAGPWAIGADRRLQQKFGLSDRATLALVLAWVGLFVVMITLRGLSRKIDFYELQMALFLAGLLMGLIWLTGRIKIDRVPAVSSAARAFAKQTYALYLTHNAVLAFYITHTGKDFGVLEGLALLVGCNVVAVPFYVLFDRHHKVVAQWIKSLGWLGAPVRERRNPVL